MSRTKKRPQKSPSERLRNVFFGLWNKDPEEFQDDFDGYYDNKMEKLINHYNKLK